LVENHRFPKSSGSQESWGQEHRRVVTAKIILISVDRFIGRLFLIAGFLLTGLGILALPPEGFFFALPMLLFMTALLLAAIGGLFFLAVKGLKRDAPWQWITQIVPLVVILCIVVLLLVTL
jgi:hypothetical protein